MFLSESTTDAAEAERVRRRLVARVDDQRGRKVSVDEEGARRTSGLVVDEQAAHHGGYGVRAAMWPVAINDTV